MMVFNFTWVFTITLLAGFLGLMCYAFRHYASALNAPRFLLFLQISTWTLEAATAWNLLLLYAGLVGSQTLAQWGAIWTLNAITLFLVGWWPPVLIIWSILEERQLKVEREERERERDKRWAA